MFLLHLLDHQLYALRYIHPLNEMKSVVYHFEVTCETGSGSIGLHSYGLFGGKSRFSYWLSLGQTSFPKPSHGAIRQNTDRPINKRSHKYI